MKTLKHTPSPWWFERTSHRAVANYCLIVHGPDKNNWETVAEVPGFYNRKTKEYEFANAHLIAAAPELYAALDDLLDKASVFIAAPGTPLDKAFDKAVKAMLKAEGK